MEKFNYKRLDGFILPSADYFRALQEHALSLERELETVREARSKDGNRFYQSEAKQDKTENRTLYKQIGQLEGKLAAMEGKHAGDLDKLRGQYEGKLREQEIRHKAELEELKKRIEVLQESQVVEVVREKPDFRMSDRERDSRGRLLPTGSSKEARKKLCYRMVELEGMEPEDVAAQIGNISPTSVKTYCSEYKKDRKRQLKALEDKRKAEASYNAYKSRMAEYGVIIG